MYKKAFIITTIEKTPEGFAEIRVPFQLYHQTIVHGNICYYSYPSSDLIGKEVLVYIHYDEKDEKTVKSFPGYLGEKWKEVRKDLRATEKWNVKKGDAYATKIGDIREEVETIKYDGLDKDDIIHPYIADDEGV